MKPRKVESLSKVDATRYIEGDLFITKRGVAMLLNGKIEPMVKQSDLKNYVKKTDVKKMIDAALELKKEGEKDVQTSE